MELSLVPTSGIPLYQQLYLQLSAQIMDGTLCAGTALPPIRTLAAELGVSIITVKRAWEALERDGFIHTHVGRGTTVAPRSASDSADQKLIMAKTQLEQDLSFYRTLGLTSRELHQLIDELYEKTDDT